MSSLETKVYATLVESLRAETGSAPDSPNKWDRSKQPELMRIAEEAVEKARAVANGSRYRVCSRCGGRYERGAEPWWCPALNGGQWAPGCKFNERDNNVRS